MQIPLGKRDADAATVSAASFHHGNGYPDRVLCESYPIKPFSVLCGSLRFSCHFFAGLTNRREIDAREFERIPYDAGVSKFWTGKSQRKVSRQVVSDNISLTNRLLQIRNRFMPPPGPLVIYVEHDNPVVEQTLLEFLTDLGNTAVAIRSDDDLRDKLETSDPEPDESKS